MKIGIIGTVAATLMAGAVFAGAPSASALPSIVSDVARPATMGAPVEQVYYCRYHRCYGHRYYGGYYRPYYRPYGYGYYHPYYYGPHIGIGIGGVGIY